MTTYYVNPQATFGNNDGTSSANAWTSLAYAPLGQNGTAPVAGDTVLCSGTSASTPDTLSSAIQFNGNSGSASAGRIIYKSAESNSARYYVDGNGFATYCMSFSGSDWLTLQGFAITGASSHGAYIPTYTAADALNFNDCFFYDNGGDGFASVGSNSTRYALFTRCMFVNNANNGWQGDGMVLGCVSSGNGLNGFYQLSSRPTTTFVDCLAYANGVYGFWMRGYGQDFHLMHNCVADNNTTGGFNVSSGLPAVISGCRVTQNGIGIDGSGGVDVLDSYMPAPGQDRDNTTNLPLTSIVNQIEVPNQISGPYSDSNDFAGTDTDAGYVIGGIPSQPDYQTTALATLHNEAYVIGGATSYPRVAGLSTLDSGGGSTGDYNPFRISKF